MLRHRVAVALGVTLVCGLATALPAHASRHTCFGRTATITGSEDEDHLHGTPGDDVIVGGGDDDEITGGGGNDRICAGAGDDRVYAGPGRDRVNGGRSDDEIHGGAGADFIDGDDQDDTLLGNAGNDRIHFGTIGRGWEYAWGGWGRDVIVGDSSGVVQAYGNEGADRLFGDSVADMLYGGPGDDRIEGGLASFGTSASPVSVDLAAGTASGEGDDTLVELAGASGSAHDDTIIGSPKGEWVQGVDGADTLFGAGGNDDVFGGRGEDVIAGNRGHDVLWDLEGDCERTGGCEGDEAVDEYGGGPGRDVLNYSGMYVPVTADLAGPGHGGDTIEDVEDLTGSSHDDVLRGHDGSNTISGGEGNDRIEGRGSDDSLDGGDGTDAIDGGGGTDGCLGEVETTCES